MTPGDLFSTRSVNIVTIVAKKKKTGISSYCQFNLLILSFYNYIRVKESVHCNYFEKIQSFVFTIFFNSYNRYVFERHKVFINFISISIVAYYNSITNILAIFQFTDM